MGTRALYFFKDYDADQFHVVYKHWDNYPSGALDFITAARDGGLSWPLPRWEADEFAAAFVSANKRECGGIRLRPPSPDVPGAPDCCDEYRYVVQSDETGAVWVAGFESGSYDRPVLGPVRLDALSASDIVEED